MPPKVFKALSSHVKPHVLAVGSDEIYFSCSCTTWGRNVKIYQQVVPCRSAQVGVFKRVCRRCIQSVDFQHSAKVNIAINECLKEHSFEDHTLF
jgi:hypothetical protein